MLAALQLSSPEFAQLGQLSEKDWKKALDFCDSAHLTLALGLTCRDYLPERVRCRIESNLTSNAERWRRTKSAYREAAFAFEADGLELAVLKGFTHCPRFVSDPRHRPQGDLDLLFAEHQVCQALDIALRLGYQPITKPDPHPIDHLPLMIRKTGWQWRGDYFDAESPASLELHFRLWDESTERFQPKDLDQFWERRQTRELDELRFVAFHPVDELGYAALHLLRHLLRGDLRSFHVYELASHLHHSADDMAFWRAWYELHDESLRRLEAICFSLARRWFDCRLPDVAEEEIERLPFDVKRWMTIYSVSPLAAQFHPNKDELWLHWALLGSTAARLAVLQRRLLPKRGPNALDYHHIPDQQLTWSIRLASQSRDMAFLASRVAHHARAMPAVAGSALRWFGAGTGLSSQYWRFFFSEAFFDFGMFVFVFLYNLYLLQLGFREDFLGLITAVMTTGSVAGSLLAVFALQRFGMRPTLMASFMLTSALCALRAYVTYQPALLALAALSGIVTSAWAVAYSPAISQLTSATNRPLGFSIFCSAGISIGILGGLAAGHLPGWLSGLGWARSSVASYRLSLFAGSAIVLLALWPLAGVKFSVTPPSDRKLHRPSPLLLRFLVAMAAWSLGTGALNPFFNVFFAERIRLPVHQIGYVVSTSQVAQVAAILLSPLVFRKFGLTRGIAGMQLATAVALLSLAIIRGPIWAAMGYSGYMMSQYMSEPGMFTLLMEGVRAGQRSSASALNFLVSFTGQAMAAAAAGWLLARYGYPPVIVGAAVICAAAGLLFRSLLSDSKAHAPSP